MNIFFLDKDPKKCAQYHNDKHLCKMIVEYAQMLSTTHYLVKSNINKDLIYKKSWEHHPCTKWILESFYNYIWLLDLLGECLEEYKIRYNKIHKTFYVYETLLIFKPYLPFVEFTTPYLAMPENCFVYRRNKTINFVSSYRKYYINYKGNLAKWTNRNKPKWYIDNDIQGIILKKKHKYSNAR